jgi:flagellar basal body rod protein FlgG
MSGSFFSVNNLTYVIQDGTPTVSLIGFENAPTVSTSIIIPVSVQDPTTSISYDVINVGEAAFLDVSYLTMVTFAPNSQLSRIGANAFRRTGLGTISIPLSVTYIDNYAFNYSALSSVIFASGIQLDSINYSVFANTNLETISIPPSVTIIKDFAFACFTAKLNSVEITMDSQLTTIKQYAFYNSNITTINIPPLVTVIDQYAFANTKLTSVIIPASVATIGQNAFNMDTTNTLVSVYFNNANALTSLGSDIFSPVATTNATGTFYNMASASDLSYNDLLSYFSTVYYISGPPPCFHPNTRLLCFNDTTGLEEWVKIMDLYKDKGRNKKVKTYLHGYRTIENIGKGCMINNPQHKIKCMYRSTELLEKELNVSELMVTGAHAILLDSTQYSTKSRHYKSVDKKWLVRACDVPAYFEKVTEVTPFDYYHLSLSPCLGSNQTIFGIYVNGDSNRDDNNRDDNMCIMETMDDAVFKKSQAFSNQ